MPGKELHRVFFILAFLAQGAAAAPLLVLDQPFVQWRPDAGPLHLAYHSRKEIDALIVNIQRLDGVVVFRDERHDLVQGPGRWRWDGTLGDGGRIAPGHYRIELRAHFDDGSEESERGDLRVLPLLEGERRPGAGFAPPPASYQPPPYELNGQVRYFERWDNSKGETLGDFRSMVRFGQRGTHHQVDLNLSYFRRTGGFSNFDNSAARIQGFWQGGGIDLVFRRSLGDFDDPLRLFADFRSQYDKRGLRFQQQMGGMNVVALALRGYPAGGAEYGQAARITGRLGGALTLGLSYTRRNLNQGPFTSMDSRAAGADLRWRPVAGQEFTFEHVESDATGPGSTRGRGRGDRLVWSYRGERGFTGSVGYLDLSPDYNAALSDPGNQVTTDAYGPEATLLWRHPGRLGPFSALRISGNLFYYDRRAQEGSINQIDFTAQAQGPAGLTLSTNLRSRQENGLRTTSLLAAARAPLQGYWQGDLQYNAAISPDSLTQRLLAGISSHRGIDHQRSLHLEIDTRHGDAVANAPVYEYGLLLSGRKGRFSCDAILRYTHAGNDAGTNLFVKASWDTLWLHRYAPLIYVSLGDRSTVRTAARIETGLELRF